MAPNMFFRYFSGMYFWVFDPNHAPKIAPVATKSPKLQSGEVETPVNRGSVTVYEIRPVIESTMTNGMVMDGWMMTTMTDGMVMDGQMDG